MKRSIVLAAAALGLVICPAALADESANSAGTTSSKFVRRYGSAAETPQVRAGERSPLDRLIVEPVAWRGYRYGYAYGPRWGYYGVRPYYAYRPYFSYGPGFYAYRPYYYSFGPPIYAGPGAYYGPRVYPPGVAYW